MNAPLWIALAGVFFFAAGAAVTWLLRGDVFGVAELVDAYDRVDQLETENRRLRERTRQAEDRAWRAVNAHALLDDPTVHLYRKDP